MTDKNWTGFVILQANPASLQAHPWTEYDGEVDPLRVLQSAVGGYLEFVRTAIPGIHMYCNEEGKLRNLPPNRLATYLLSQYNRDVIMGNVIVLRDGKAGEEAPLDATDLRAITQAVGLTSGA